MLTWSAIVTTPILMTSGHLEQIEAMRYTWLYYFADNSQSISICFSMVTKILQAYLTLYQCIQITKQTRGDGLIIM